MLWPNLSSRPLLGWQARRRERAGKEGVCLLLSFNMIPPNRFQTDTEYIHECKVRFFFLKNAAVLFFIQTKTPEVIESYIKYIN